MQVFNNSLIQGQTMSTREIKLALDISTDKDRISPSVPILL